MVLKEKHLMVTQKNVGLITLIYVNLSLIMEEMDVMKKRLGALEKVNFPSKPYDDAAKHIDNKIMEIREKKVVI